MNSATEQSKTLLRHANRVVAIMREEIAAHGRLHELLGRQEASVTAPGSEEFRDATIGLEAELARAPHRVSKRTQALADLAEALGVAGYPAAVPVLKAQLARLTSPAKASGQTAPPRSHIFVGKQTAYVQDFDVEVAQASAIADPQVNALNQGAVLDVRVIAVTSGGTATRTELAAVRAALASLQAREAAEKAKED